MLYPVANLVLLTVTKAGRAHFQCLVNHVGPITEAEVDVKMAEAALIHAREWNASPHPLDAMVPPEAHDWAVRHIAPNLVARERGYVVSSPPDRRLALLRREMDLVPARRTEDWTQR